MKTAHTLYRYIEATLIAFNYEMQIEDVIQESFVVLQSRDAGQLIDIISISWYETRYRL